jgi:hypothetical protein
MADREYLRPPQQNEFKGVGIAGFRYMQQIANKINELLTMKNDLGTYADNSAAIAGGLAVGDWYKTAAGAIRIVV